jgi:hypothetical protein
MHSNRGTHIIPDLTWALDSTLTPASRGTACSIELHTQLSLVRYILLVPTILYSLQSKEAEEYIVRAQGRPAQALSLFFPHKLCPVL